MHLVNGIVNLITSTLEHVSHKSANNLCRLANLHKIKSPYTIRYYIKTLKVSLCERNRDVGVLFQYLLFRKLVSYKVRFRYHFLTEWLSGSMYYFYLKKRVLFITYYYISLMLCAKNGLKTFRLVRVLLIEKLDTSERWDQEI